jgi:8-oxo-dGTP pyrophosphatase MutT (NUDIX family)
MMMAILHGKAGKTARGDQGPPKSIAERYDGEDKDLPEDKGKAHHGGRWDGHTKGKKHKKLKKSATSGAGVVVVNGRGQILLGRHSTTGEWALPGGGREGSESLRATAVRELEEETGFKFDADKLSELESTDLGTTFLARVNETPEVHSTDELNDVGFYDLDTVDLNKLRACCFAGLKAYLDGRVTKSYRSLSEAMALETLNKNIIRTDQVDNAVHELTHSDALKLVGNGAFRALRAGTQGMGNDEIRDLKFGHYTVHIRKHANDVYSGNIDDGLKTIHQFTNRSLPAMTAEIMSVFEWYLPEDMKDLPVDENLPDDVIDEGLGKLVQNYRNYNLADIYDEMENLREEIRQGNAVDLQQAEAKIMKLFDSVEERVKEIEVKRDGSEVEDLREKLLQLQSKVDEMGKKPSKVEAFSSNPANPVQVFSQFYNYLSRPKVVVHPSGYVVIDFGVDWTGDDKTNFLQDLRAKAISRRK